MSVVRRVDENWDMTFGRGRANYATGVDAAAQQVKNRLLTFEGEWFLDLDAGLKWFQQILTKPANENVIAVEIKSAILSIDNVAAINSYRQTINPETRRLLVVTSLTSTDGSVTTVQVQN